MANKKKRTAKYNNGNNSVIKNTESLKKQDDKINNRNLSIENKDLIISREISVDGNFDIKNKKKVRELGKTIEKFNQLEKLKKISGEKKEINKMNECNGSNKNYLHWEKATDDLVIKEVNDAVNYDTNQKLHLILITACVSIVAIILIVVTFYYSSFRTNDKKNTIAYSTEVNDSRNK